MTQARRNRGPWTSLRQQLAVCAGWPLLRIALLLLALVGAGIGFTWRRLRPLVVHQRQYLVDAQDIHLTPRPAWIGTDIRREVLHDPRLAQPLSVLDDDLAQRLATAFEFHPWVAKVKRVVKQFGPVIRVDVVYRKPVVMVQLDDGPVREEMPADNQGVRLPDLHVPAGQAGVYPRVRGGSTVPLVGEAWLDRGVIDTARIAGRLGDLAHTLHITRIVAVPPRPDRMDPGPPMYDLQLRDGRSIRWGHTPSDLQAGEPGPGEKVERLRMFLHLSSPTARASNPFQLDLSRSEPAGGTLPNR